MRSLRAEDPERIGDYRLLARLGEGGMGSVYLAQSPRGRTVAVKLVRRELAAHAEFRHRFEQEVGAARRVGGEWTAPVLDADTGAEQPWVATGYIPGITLQEAVAGRSAPLPGRTLRILANRLGLALRAVHAAGIVHRDVKPSNILVTIDGPRVIDFGIARALETVAADAELTRTGAVVGSPGFMSPEQVRGERLTGASDIFSLGSVLAFAATGRTPFGGDGVAGHVQMYRITQEEPRLEGVPDALRELVADCLAKDPARRPDIGSLLERTADPQDAPGPGPAAADAAEPWLPAALVAQLGRHAAQLLDMEVPGAQAAADRAAEAPAVPPPTRVAAGPAPDADTPEAGGRTPEEPATSAGTDAGRGEGPADGAATEDAAEETGTGQAGRGAAPDSGTDPADTADSTTNAAGPADAGPTDAVGTTEAGATDAGGTTDASEPVTAVQPLTGTGSKTAVVTATTTPTAPTSPTAATSGTSATTSKPAAASESATTSGPAAKSASADDSASAAPPSTAPASGSGTAPSPASGAGPAGVGAPGAASADGAAAPGGGTPPPPPGGLGGPHGTDVHGMLTVTGPVQHTPPSGQWAVPGGPGGPQAHFPAPGEPPAQGRRRGRAVLLGALGVVLAVAAGAGTFVALQVYDQDGDGGKPGSEAGRSPGRGEQGEGRSGGTAAPEPSERDISSPAPGGALPRGYLGAWQGSVQDADGSTITRRFEIRQGRKGEVIAKTVNLRAGMMCEGRATLVAFDGGAAGLRITSTITQSHPVDKPCSPYKEQRLVLRGDGSLSWTYPAGSLSAKLHRVGDPARPVPARLAGEWKGVTADGQERTLSVERGRVGSATLVVSGRGPDGDCEWESELAAADGNTLSYGPDVVTRDRTGDGCSVTGSSVTLTAVGDDELRMSPATPADAPPLVFRRP
ncbi:serine/threonine-protein kinase [Streptomyces albus]|uniref:serine/threonine-protein kinase n=2 Tax=Streptomyces albus TaxID=1888 RepID=UPI0024E0F4C1|nr:serine/threonine protein kinase [Streptomyces albus]GHJ25319.1 hypothetical protein TPA0909_69330 [Streptomyces albus]